VQFKMIVTTFLENRKVVGCWWLTSVILATWETKMGKIGA
jgi:hypothetical protein